MHEPGQPVEMPATGAARLAVVPPKPPLRDLGREATGAAGLASDAAYFPGVGRVDAHDRTTAPRWRPGDRIDGPGLIDEPTTTVVVPPGSALTVTSLGNYLLEIE